MIWMEASLRGRGVGTLCEMILSMLQTAIRKWPNSNCDIERNGPNINTFGHCSLCFAFYFFHTCIINHLNLRRVERVGGSMQLARARPIGSQWFTSYQDPPFHTSINHFSVMPRWGWLLLLYRGKRGVVASSTDNASCQEGSCLDPYQWWPYPPPLVQDTESTRDRYVWVTSKRTVVLLPASATLV